MSLEEALSAISGGNSVLFVGSGFSKGARNLKGEDFKIGAELAKDLAKHAKVPETFPLEDAAEAYERQFGAEKLINELKQEFTASKIADHHREIAKAPWRRVYTTNYDNVFELAAKDAGRKFDSVTMAVDPYAVQKDTGLIIHLNGSIEQLTPQELNTTFKLTETSYIAASIENSAWAIRLREDVRLASSVFFIGYSMYDLDVKRILADSPLLREKAFFVVGKNPNELLTQRVSRFGQIATLTGEELAEHLTRSARPLAKSDFEFRALQEFRRSLDRGLDFRDQDLIDLFELGVVNQKAIGASLAGRIKYYLEREYVRETLQLLREGQPLVAITSGVGNGKTLILEGIAFRAVEQGFRVFTAQNLTEDAALEFETVAKLDEKSLVIIDDYHAWLREIRAFRQIRNDKAQMIVATRDITHDVLFERLEREAGLESVPEIKGDKLLDSEIEWWVETLNQFGLWAEHAGLLRHEKIRIIRDGYDREIRGILIALLHSTDIGERLRKLFKGDGGSRYHDIMASVFVLASVKSIPPKIEMLYDIWGIDVISSSAFRNDVGVRSLLDFNSWTVRARSAVVAEYLLRNVFSDRIVNLLIKMMKALANGARATRQYRSIFEELVRFSTLQRILPEDKPEEAAIRYYEGIKDLPLNRSHPLFWLQFGIACLFQEDVVRARRYFETAYSLAGRTSFDTYQIDNHYARLLLVEARVLRFDIIKAMANFREARAIINRQLQHERRRYPYRVARGYQDFLDAFTQQMNSAQLEEVKTAAEFIVENINNLSPFHRDNPAVRECNIAMRYVIGRCNEIASRRPRR
jgi:hypothetical protein